MPAISYLMAVLLQVAPLAEWSIRAPTALVGVASIALTYFAGPPAYWATADGRCGALTMACAPAHFILSRYAVDYTTDSVCADLAAVPVDRARARPVARLVPRCGRDLGAGWYSTSPPFC